MSNGDTIMRAFALARTGHYADIWALRDQLRRERMVNTDQNLSGKLIKTQLKAAIRAARGVDDGAPAAGQPEP